MQTDAVKVISLKALDLLARREHTTQEMHTKLCLRGFEAELVGVAIERLVHQGLLSNFRFVECFVRSRMNRGFGPLRIQNELRQRGIDDPLIRDSIDINAAQWLDNIRDVWHKRFDGRYPADLKERARQARFLRQRGFTGDQVKAVMNQDDQL